MNSREKKIDIPIAWGNEINKHEKIELQNYHRKFTELFTEKLYNLKNLLSKGKLDEILTQLNEIILEKTTSECVPIFVTNMGENILSFAETHFDSDFFPLEFINTFYGGEPNFETKSDSNHEIYYSVIEREETEDFFLWIVEFENIEETFLNPTTNPLSIFIKIANQIQNLMELRCSGIKISYLNRDFFFPRSPSKHKKSTEFTVLGDTYNKEIKQNKLSYVGEVYQDEFHPFVLGEKSSLWGSILNECSESIFGGKFLIAEHPNSKKIRIITEIFKIEIWFVKDFKILIETIPVMYFDPTTKISIQNLYPINPLNYKFRELNSEELDLIKKTIDKSGGKII